MIRLCKAENRNLFENNFLRINALDEETKNSDFAFIDDIALNELGVYQKVVKESGYLILLPLLNEIHLNMNGYNWNIKTNQVFVYYLEKGSIIEIQGELKDEFSYLYSLFLIKPKATINNIIAPVELEKNNHLNKIVRHSLFNIFLGKFDDRKEAELPLKRVERSWSIISLTGIFEVHDRLIESRDLLTITSDEHVGFESLSEDSLLMVIDY